MSNYQYNPGRVLTPKHPETGVFDVLYYGATGDGVTDDSAALQAAIDAAAAAGGGSVEVKPGTYIADGLTLSASVHLLLHPEAKIEHGASSGVCITVEENTSILGGEIYRDSTGVTYTGTLIATDSTAAVSRETPINISTALRCIGQHQGTGLLVEADGTTENSWVQWSRFDVNCTSLETAVKLYAHGQSGGSGIAFINGNTFNIQTQNCDYSLIIDALISTDRTSQNTFNLLVQAAANSERAIQMHGAQNSTFHCRIFDWHGAAVNEQPIHRPAGTSEQANYRNNFYGVDFYDFMANTTIADMRLGGAHNKIVVGSHGGSPLRCDSSVANTSNLYVPTTASYVEGHLWWDDNGGKLKFSNGTAIETVTSA